MRRVSSILKNGCPQPKARGRGGFETVSTGSARYEGLFVIVQRGYLSRLLLYIGVFLRMRARVFRTERDVI